MLGNMMRSCSLYFKVTFMQLKLQFRLCTQWRYLVYFVRNDRRKMILEILYIVIYILNIYDLLNVLCLEKKNLSWLSRFLQLLYSLQDRCVCIGKVRFCLRKPCRNIVQIWYNIAFSCMYVYVYPWMGCEYHLSG